jgi:hypothetical protein
LSASIRARRRYLLNILKQVTAELEGEEAATWRRPAGRDPRSARQPTRFIHSSFHLCGKHSMPPSSTPSAMVPALTDDWLPTYNDDRPHDALVRIPSTRFLAAADVSLHLPSHFVRTYDITARHRSGPLVQTLRGRTSGGTPP